MKANVFDLNGNVKEKIELPEVFEESFRPDLIKRAVISLQSARRQPYGSDPDAGLRSSAHYHGRRRKRFTMMMRDMARHPRIHGGPPHMLFRARKVPEAVKGRRAHPPKVEKVWEQKINKKEERLALKSAIAATAKKEIVETRGHKTEKIKEFPLIVVDDIQSMKKTKDVENLLNKLGLTEELDRSREKKVRAGKGKLRSRKYKKKRGPLIIISEDKGLLKAGKNIPGVDVRDLKEVSVEDLAPGTHAGRLTVYSKSAIQALRGF